MFTHKGLGHLSPPSEWPLPPWADTSCLCSSCISAPGQGCGTLNPIHKAFQKQRGCLTVSEIRCVTLTFDNPFMLQASIGNHPVVGGK